MFRAYIVSSYLFIVVYHKRSINILKQIDRIIQALKAITECYNLIQYQSKFQFHSKCSVVENFPIKMKQEEEQLHFLNCKISQS